MSDSDAKTPKAQESRKGGSGGRRSGGANVGNALKAAYEDALKEDIPADLLALLGKLD